MEITGLDDEIKELGLTVLENAANDLLDDLKADAPFETGELRDSAFGPDIDETAFTATVGFTAPQADFTNEGVRPHDIYPVHSPVLTFYWPNGPDGPGVYHFKHVNHPGQEATHWFDDAIDNWPDYVQSAADEL